MSRLTPAMDAALAATRATIFCALQMDLPGAVTVRLLDGASELDFNGGTFRGRDPTFGVLGALDTFSDGAGDEAPGLSVSLLPASAAAAANLSHPAMQGSRVRLWLGAVVEGGAGGVVADPYLVFDGELDTPDLTVGEKEVHLEMSCVSGLERLFDNDEGARLSDAFHQSIWPGEQGFRYVTGIVRSIIWGPGERPGGMSYGSGRGGGFGGGSSGSGTVGGINYGDSLWGRMFSGI